MRLGSAGMKLIPATGRLVLRCSTGSLGTKTSNVGESWSSALGFLQKSVRKRRGEEGCVQGLANAVAGLEARDRNRGKADDPRLQRHIGRLQEGTTKCDRSMLYRGMRYAGTMRH